MCIPAVALAGMAGSAGGSILKGIADKNQVDAQAATLRYNAQLAGMAASDAEIRGGQAAGDAVTKGTEIQGAQEAAIAAGGIDPSQGSAAAAITDTARLAQLDALRAKNNAAREAWGYKTQAADLEFQRSTTIRQGQLQTMADIIGGANSLFGQGEKYDLFPKPK